MKQVFVLLAVIIAGAGLAARAQNLAVKTNLLSDAVLSPNLGLEAGLAPKWTLDVSGQLNAWTLSHDRRWKHWAAQPEIRYWLCDRFGSHFLGAHIHGGQFNFGGFDGLVDFLGTDARKLKDSRY